MKIFDEYRIVKKDKLNLGLERRIVRINKKTKESYEAWQTLGWYGGDLRAALKAATLYKIDQDIENCKDLKECLVKLDDIKQLINNLKL